MHASLSGFRPRFGFGGLSSGAWDRMQVCLAFGFRCFRLCRFELLGLGLGLGVLGFAWTLGFWVEASALRV